MLATKKKELKEVKKKRKEANTDEEKDNEKD